MSTLTKCCECEGCQPEQLFWVAPGLEASASAPEGSLPTGPTGCVEVASFEPLGPPDFHRLTGDCESLAVTTETERNSLVADVRLILPQSGGYGLEAGAKAFDIALKLWCNEVGGGEVGTVRIWAELGSNLLYTKFTADPESTAIVTPSQGALGFNAFWLKMYATLTCGGNSSTVQLIFPTWETALFNELGNVSGLNVRVTATYSEGELDANCSYTTYPDYGEGERSNRIGYSEQPINEIKPTWSPEDPGAMGFAPFGTLISGFPPARRHSFPTASVTKQHKRMAATIEVNSDWKWRVLIRAKSYNTNYGPSVPAVPELEDDECVCMPTGATGPAECYVARTSAETVAPENPYSYPWFLSPCNHSRRGSRVTHGMVSSQFRNLTVTLPEYQGGPFELNGYFSSIPSGPYELGDVRDGDSLADDTFWLAAGPIPDVIVSDGYFGNTGFKTESVTVAASVRTILIRPNNLGGVVLLPLTVLTPCPEDADEWQTEVMVFVYLRGRYAINYNGGEFPETDSLTSKPFAVWMTHSHAIGSEFFRGEEISIGVSSACAAQWIGEKVPAAFPTNTTLYQLLYGSPLKVQLLGE